VYDALRERGVLVKRFHAGPEPLPTCLRVTVGKPEENQKFLESLRASLAAGKVK
jgi:histidinol-phosphate aminotransferase